MPPLFHSLDVFKGVREFHDFFNASKFPFSRHPCVDFNASIGFCRVEWSAEKSPQASHSDRGRREVKISPAFTLKCSDGVSEIINFTQVVMCFFDSGQDPPTDFDTRR